MDLPELSRTRAWAKIAALLCFISTLSIGAIAAPSLEIRSSPVRLEFNGVEEPAILQRSDDLENWEDLFIATPEFNGKQIKEVISDDKRKIFYRFKALEAPLKIRLNAIPGHPLLARITNDKEVSIDIFGSRDPEGYPDKISNINYRVGTRTLITQPLFPLHSFTKSRQQAALDNGQIWDGLEFFSGLVVIHKSGPCRMPSTSPVVEFISVQENRDSPAKRYSGSMTTYFQPELSTDSQTVFRYEVPYSFSYQNRPPTDVERAKRGLDRALKEYADLEEYGVDKVLGYSAIMVGGPFGEVVPVIQEVVGWFTVALAFRKGVLDETYVDPYNSPVQETDYSLLRAYVGAPTDDNPYKTEWVREDSPSFSKEGPVLTIDCHDPINLTKVSAGVVSVANFYSPNAGDGDEGATDASANALSPAYQFTNGESWAFTSASANIAPQEGGGYSITAKNRAEAYTDYGLRDPQNGTQCASVGHAHVNFTLTVPAKLTFRVAGWDYRGDPAGAAYATSYWHLSSVQTGRNITESNTVASGGHAPFEADLPAGDYSIQSTATMQNSSGTGFLWGSLSQDFSFTVIPLQ